MTVEEAIKDIKENIKPIVGGISLDMAIEALEKQIPIKPIMREYCPAYCPVCRAELSESKGDGYYKHHYSLKVCNCGQKLKWD